MIIKCIQYFNQPAALACDGLCSKAWGVNSRPRVSLSKTDEDDYEYLSDIELGDAPLDPGSYEGGDAKPIDKSQRLNKWCARECERSMLITRKNELNALADFNVRISNKHSIRAAS